MTLAVFKAKREKIIRVIIADLSSLKMAENEVNC